MQSYLHLKHITKICNAILILILRSCVSVRVLVFRVISRNYTAFRENKRPNISDLFRKSDNVETLESQKAEIF